MPGIIIPYLLWQAAGLGVMYTSWSFFRSKERAEKGRRLAAQREEEEKIKAEKVVPHYKGLCCECKYLAQAEGHTSSYCTYLGESKSMHTPEGRDCEGYVMRRRSGAMRASHSWDWQQHYYRSHESVQVYDQPPRPPSSKTIYIDGMQFHDDNKYWRENSRWGMAYENCKDDPEKLKALDIIFSDDRIHYT